MAKKSEARTIEEVVKFGYQSFSSYVTQERLVPNIEDGLKPVYRRVIAAAHEICARNYIKTATLSGYVLGKLHPHSVDAIDEVITQLVHMGILDGDGAFGCRSLMGNHSPASASRYTQVKLSAAYSDLLDMLLKYVPLVEGEMDNMEPAFIPTPLPILCSYGSFSLAPALMVQLPAFTYQSMYDAYQSKDCSLLQSAFGYKIVNTDQIKHVWADGKANIWYTLSVYQGNLSGQRGVFIEGSPELFIPELKSLAEWQSQGLVSIMDVSAGNANRIFVGLNKGVRSLKLEQVYTRLRAVSASKNLVSMLALVDKVAYPVGLRVWIDTCLNNFCRLVDEYKSDNIRICNEKIRLFQNFDVVRKYIIDHIKKYKLTAEEISKATRVSIDIVRAIDAMSVKTLRSTDPEAEIEKYQKKIKEIEKIRPRRVAEEFIRKVNRPPAFQVKDKVSLKEIEAAITADKEASHG